MTDATFSGAVSPSRVGPRAASSARGPRLRRGLLVGALFAGAGWGAFGTGAEENAAALARAGAELAQLLRFMALLKATMALTASGGVWWRLGGATSPGWLLSYLAAGAALAAGPGLIWGMAHVGLGALLLHGGLLATLVLLWADPAVGRILGEALAARRRALAPR